ncbi:MAG: right-handed parallel beta-helix repeat-containing protein, partial [bacterium]
GEPYVLTGNVKVPGGGRLIIDPGVKVMPRGNYGIYPYYQNPYWQYIYAQGSAINPIRFTPHRKLYPVSDSIPTGFWKGIHINADARAESLIFDYCIIEGAGSDSAALWVHNANQILSVSNTEISKSGSYGIYCNHLCHNVSVVNCLFKDIDSIPLHGNFKWIGEIYDNRFEDNRLNVIAIESGSRNTDAVIHNQGVPYWFLKGTFVVESSNDTSCPTLTVQPGVKIFFHDSSGLYLGLYPYPMRGKILAQGTADSMIIFSALDTTKHWRGIHIADNNIADTSKFEYCEISYGGRILNSWDDRAGGNIGFLYDHTPYILKNCKIKRSLSSGCGNFWVTSGRDSLVSWIQNNLFEGNDSVPLYLGANELGGCYGNSFVNNGVNGIFVKNEQIDHSLTIAHQGIPYVFYPKGTYRLFINGRLGVAEVLVAPNNVLKFAGGFLSIGDSGVVKAQSVTFTAFDTAWGGIKFDYAELDTSVFDSCVIEKAVDYGGSGWPSGAVHLNGSRVMIKNSAIVNNGKGLWLAYENRLNLTNNLIAQNKYGIYRASSDFIPDSIIIKNNSFLGNRVAVINTRTSRFLDADSNWWGDETGPWDPSTGAPDSNPQGRGDSIGDYVVYRPWLTSPVQPQIVTLLKPNGGEVLYSGENYEISWANDSVRILRQELYYTTDFPEGGAKADAFWRFIDTVPVGKTSYVWTVPNTPSRRCRVAVKIYYESEKQGIGETGRIKGDLKQFKAQRGLREIKGNQGISGVDNYGTEVPTPEKQDRPGKSEMVAVDISDGNFTIPITTDFALSTAYNNGHKIVSSPTGKTIHFVYANEGWSVPSGIFNCYSDDSGKTFSSLIQIDSTGLYPALALRSNGQPCAAWPVSEGIKYAYWIASWTDTLFLPVMNSSLPSIGVDNRDTVHLIFVQYRYLPPTTGDLIYLKFHYNNFNGAMSETLFTDNYCHTPCLALDQDHNIHLIWQGEKSICYLMKDSNGVWHNIDTVYTTITNERLYPVI